MMKTRVRVLIGGVIALVAVFAIIAWACRSEYGKGYSEDQRRNWNEMVSSAEGVLNWNHMYSKSEALRRRRAQDDAPAWKLDFSKPPAKLPLEGMTLPGLERLADQGNGDACLELAFRSSSTAFISDIYPMEKNVRKAVKSGRAGADFLLRILELRKTRGDGFQGSDVDGYGDFLSHLDKGDFMLGKVYACLVHSDDEAMDRLGFALRERAGQGDLVALRNAGYLGILRRSESMRHQWWGRRALESTGNNPWEMAQKVMKPIESGLELLPDEMKPDGSKRWDIKEWIEKKIESHYWEALQRSLDDSFGMLLKASEQGDLHAKFLWTHYMVLGQRTLSRDEWEKHLRYANELIQAGGIYRGAHPQWFDWDYFEIESRFYQEASVDNLWRPIKEQKDKEYSAFKTNLDLPDSLHRMDMEALCNMHYFADSFVEDVGDFGDHQLNKEEQRHGYHLLEQAADGGSPQAMFALARLLNAGLVVEQDVARSWKLLEKAKAWCDGIRDKREDSGSVSVSRGTHSSATMGLNEAVEWQMLDIVSRYGDMPGMTEKEVLERVQSCFLYEELLKRIKEQFEKRGVKVPDKKK